jgi:hypothetical protein
VKVIPVRPSVPDDIQHAIRSFLFPIPRISRGGALRENL